jgi:hypothetical protein
LVLDTDLSGQPVERRLSAIAAIAAAVAACIQAFLIVVPTCINL